MKVVVLAGGVGGAKFVDGLACWLSPQDLSVIVNTGDDFEYLSLRISPDLDTVCYMLAGVNNPRTGWGLDQETWVTFDQVAKLGGPDWFRIGDKDLATHLVRTSRLNQGESLSDITREFCKTWGVRHPVYPMTDDPVRTIVHTSGGQSLGFQEYFVHQAFQPVVESFEFRGASQAKPVPEALDALKNCDLVIIAPSNPWVSIDPILAVPGYREVIAKKLVIAVSPLIGGKAVKGPAAKIYHELGFQPSAATVANHYRDLLSGFVFDSSDKEELQNIERWFIIPLTTNIMMKTKEDRVRLAEETLRFCKMILNRSR